MSVPTRWASSYRYKSFQVTGDVADIVTQIRAELKTYGSPAWTEPNANEFLSPADAWGRQFRLTFSRIDADTLEMNVKDPTLNVQTGRMDIAASPNVTVVELYTGQQHFLCTAWQPVSGSYEFLHAGIICQDYYSDQAYIPQMVFAMTTRDSAGAVRSSPVWYYAQTLDTGGLGSRFVNSSACYVMSMPDGSIPLEPVHVAGRDLLNNWYLLGHLYQACVVTTTGIRKGINFTVPIAPGVLGTFRVAWMSHATGATQLCYRIA